MIHKEHGPAATGSIAGEKNVEVGIKYDEEKARYDLLPFDALEEIVLVFTEGAKKYNDRNWEKGIKYGRLLAAALRHISAFAMGRRMNTEDFGLHHLAHAAVCIMMLLAYDLRGMYDYDDLGNKTYRR